MKKEEAQAFYTRIYEPNEKRRILLEATKRMIQLMQKYDGLKATRLEKLRNIVELKKTMNEIDVLATKLKNIYPKIKLPAPPKKVVKPKPMPKPKPKPAPKPKKPEIKLEELPEEERELRKLESELGHIESKIKAL